MSKYFTSDRTQSVSSTTVSTIGMNVNWFFALSALMKIGWRHYGYQEDNQRMYRIWSERIEKDPTYIMKFGRNIKHRNLNGLSGVRRACQMPTNSRCFLSSMSIGNCCFFQPIGDVNLTIDITLSASQKFCKNF